MTVVTELMPCGGHRVSVRVRYRAQGPRGRFAAEGRCCPPRGSGLVAASICGGRLREVTPVETGSERVRRLVRSGSIGDLMRGTRALGAIMTVFGVAAAI